MSNDTPPHACLADFDFMTMVLDPDHPMSCSTQLEGGTLMFMSPELLAPQNFGMKHSIPTPQSDVYAFGLVIFQVRGNDDGHENRSSDIVQVLTGEIPFPRFGLVGFLFYVMGGLRPVKPNNAPTVGFSDLLWEFVQRCWDANMKLRPEVAEVVAQLSKATADWDGVIPPHVKAECVATETGELMHVEMFMESPDSMEYCEFRIFIVLDVSHPATVQVESSASLWLPLGKIPPSLNLSLHHPPIKTHHPRTTRTLAKTTNFHCSRPLRGNGQASGI